jgi:hypothetical protein
MNNSRRIAGLMCSAAVGVFVSIMMLTAEPVSARSCQEQCDAETAAASLYCEYYFTPGTEDYNACHAARSYQYWLCSTGAYTCGHSYYCTVIAFDGIALTYGCSL